MIPNVVQSSEQTLFFCMFLTTATDLHYTYQTFRPPEVSLWGTANNFWIIPLSGLKQNQWFGFFYYVPTTIGKTKKKREQG